MATTSQMTSTGLESLNNINVYLGDDYGNIHLTKCEAKVLHCTILGYTAKKTAKHLNISFRTVEAYIDTLKLKLHCNTKRQLIELVIKNKILGLLEL